ncbi:Orm1 type endoplasmic reticulum protein [Lentinula raphanica]|uniref:Orm1 type endoplasmic reticulum protein n=1 Tax=Lentinula raphanica TaxID=153919 RepID=A0AA38ULJ4_9AGAR|nr:Orm1 type endoplasmic reticulum protein [Lentinula raphanica]KAJ3771137.1 Orm1 type endoplasmic reticulum protein [Lentinula raphanica]KAJ3843092.1 Orm1 type endoplasmic reticulum protein [Lentinula raphanica]KAJ3975971.1 Orm1 type endoplasmic reticulum protein [Lentinula raphanica]
MQSHRSIAIQPLDITPQPRSSPSAPAMKSRGRSSSLLKVEHVVTSTVEDLDQSTYLNNNANWVNAKGAWLIHVVLICIGKIIIDTIPGMEPQISWTLVNLLYLALSYLMFHWVTGIPFQSDMHGGAYDDLTLWEQIDDGAQYTPAKKWLFSVPCVLFLASTHYTNYNPWLFAINLCALVFVLLPKLPQLHRQRVRFLADDRSGASTPVTTSFPPSGASTPINGGTPPVIITESLFQ